MAVLACPTVAEAESNLVPITSLLLLSYAESLKLLQPLRLHSQRFPSVSLAPYTADFNELTTGPGKRVGFVGRTARSSFLLVDANNITGPPTRFFPRLAAPGLCEATIQVPLSSRSPLADQRERSPRSEGERNVIEWQTSL